MKLLLSSSLPGNAEVVAGVVDVEGASVEVELEMPGDVRMVVGSGRSDGVRPMSCPGQAGTSTFMVLISITLVKRASPWLVTKTPWIKANDSLPQTSSKSMGVRSWFGLGYLVSVLL